MTKIKSQRKEEGASPKPSDKTDIEQSLDEAIARYGGYFNFRQFIIDLLKIQLPLKRSLVTSILLLFTRRCLGEEELVVVDHNADKRAGSTESQGEAPLASGEECMADVAEISLPVASIVPESSSSQEHTSETSENHRVRVSPLSEVAVQVVDGIIKSSDSEERVRRSRSESTSRIPEIETTDKQTTSAKDTDPAEAPTGSGSDSENPAPLNESKHDDTTKPKKSPSQTILISEDTDILQIAGVQMGALKTLNALMMSSRYIELLLVPKSDLVEEKKPSDDEDDKCAVSSTRMFL